MSEPTSPDTGPRERLHPLFLLAGLGGSLRGIAGGYAALGYLAVSGRLRTALILAVAMLALMLVSVFIYWRKFEFRVGANEIRIDSGIFSRTHRSIPFDRIQDVDISQGPFARLFGIARVKFETGASSSPTADEGVLQAIPLDRAEQLRALVRTRRSRSAAQPFEQAEAEPQPIYAMGVRRLLLAGLFNFSLAVFAGLFGATQTFGQFLGFDPLDRSFWRELLSVGDPVRDAILAHQATAAAAGLILLVLIGSATGIVRTTLRDYGFRLQHTGTGLRRRRGLLTLTDVTLPLRRVQAAVVATGPVRDRFGWRELRLQNLARDEKSGDHVVAPLADDREVGAILGEIGWPPLPGELRWHHVSSAYVGTLAAGLAPLALIAAVQAAFVPFMGIAFGIGLAGALGLRWLAWRRTAYALDGDRLLVRTGWWRRRLRILPLDKIQSIDIAESFVGRWFGTATLIFGVAGGGGGFAAHKIPAIERDKGRGLRDQLLASRS